ncbi:MAG TPA: uroporphyrinogen-III synthase, partial [Actinomycetota bacterium]
MTRSLEGRVVLVTRPLGQGGELGRLLRERGATAVAAPTIDLHPAEDHEELARSVVGLAEGRFSWLVVTSRAGVEALARAGLGRMEANVAAVGEGTARALRERGVEPALVPS